MLVFMTFGKTFKRILQDKGWTQKGLAEELKIDEGYLSRLANDKAGFSPSREFIIRVVAKLGCSETERNELLREAGRVDKELEDIAREATAKPKLQELFRSLHQLDDKDLENIRKKVEAIRAKNKTDDK